MTSGEHTMNPAVTKVFGKSSRLVSRRVKLESARFSVLSLNIDNGDICQAVLVELHIDISLSACKLKNLTFRKLTLAWSR